MEDPYFEIEAGIFVVDVLAWLLFMYVLIVRGVD